MRIHLIQLFEETVNRYPQKTAVIDKDRSVNFSDLRQKAVQTAATIALKDVPQNKPIGVFLDKSVESVYADLGILYAGDFYMNLDIKTPAERIKNILQLVEPAAIISTSVQIKSIATIIPEGVKLILLDEQSQGLTQKRCSVSVVRQSLTPTPRASSTPLDRLALRRVWY